jgi:hypothetical protein
MYKNWHLATADKIPGEDILRQAHQVGEFKSSHRRYFLRPNECFSWAMHPGCLCGLKINVQYEKHLL